MSGGLRAKTDAELLEYRRLLAATNREVANKGMPRSLRTQWHVVTALNHGLDAEIDRRICDGTFRAA